HQYIATGCRTRYDLWATSRVVCRALPCLGALLGCLDFLCVRCDRRWSFLSDHCRGLDDLVWHHLVDCHLPVGDGSTWLGRRFDVEGNQRHPHRLRLRSFWSMGAMELWPEAPR